MQLVTGQTITLMSGSHTMKTDIFGGWQSVNNPVEFSKLVTIYKIQNSVNLSDEEKRIQIEPLIKELLDNHVDADKKDNPFIAAQNMSDQVVPDQVNDQLKSPITSDAIKPAALLALERLINFFAEFQFEPNYRFVNTIAQLKGDEAKHYIENYFKLTDNAYASTILEKMSSKEFTEILDVLSKQNPSVKVNERFKVYYGPQGTGKTTIALKESEGRCMVCHSAMLPSDLMEDFTFNDGKAAFQPSVLALAMMKGYCITLDEINLLPFESLRFIQGLLDRKDKFLYKGIEVNIKEGFKVIGTMNLSVNGSVYSLPEPLVDRAENLVECKLTAEQLLKAVE